MSLPTTARTDVSPNELKLRKLDNRDRLARGVGFVILLMIVVVNVLALVRINQLATDNAKNNLQAARQLTVAALLNKSRLDVDLCIVSVPPQTRTPEYVKACYDDVEKAEGVKIERFGYGAL